MDYDKILKRSLDLSKPYWDLYDQLIGSKSTEPTVDICDKFNQDESSSDQQDEELNPDYIELARITREHQAKREKQKRSRQKKGLDIETYYKDISQVDTLVEDNLVEVPNRSGGFVSSTQKEQELIELYGGREAYEYVRSIEMQIDDHFHRKCQEFKPGYWPVIPINYRRYLGSVER